MRLFHVILGELRLLYKYGIVLLYFIFTIIYICIISLLPESVKQVTTIILIFFDPAAMGLFFMGAIILFEKNQRVESSLAVSPIHIIEYIIGKVIPFLLIGSLVALIIAIFASLSKIWLIIIGVFLSSILFSLCGMIVACNITSLNKFMIATIPFEIFLCVPSALYLFEVIKSDIWILHPGIAAIRIISGNSDYWFFAILSMLIWIIPIYIVCKKAVIKSFSRMEGIKL